MKEVIIIGAGGHAAELRDYINHFNQRSEDKIRVVGFIDDEEVQYNYYDFTEKYLGSIKEHKVLEDIYYIMGIANLKYRKPIVESFLKNGAQFIRLIHPTALVSPSAEIGEGVIISHNVSIGPKAIIGDFNMLNSRCTIGHDSKIGNYNFISPQVAISGSCIIGNENMIGTNACTIPGISIGNNNIIAAGMTINRTVRDNETIIYRHKERLILREPKK